MRKLLGLVSLTAGASVVLALGGPGALVPFKAAAAAVEEVSVAFVVDFGGGNVKTACVKVPSTDNEYQALAAFTQQENEAAPTYSDSGLLCSIGGVPTSGCGQNDGGGYIYWSYWHGDSGTWTYSNTGASGTVHACNAQGGDCDVEGWKFENPGAGNPTDPPPATAPAYTAICSQTASTTTTSTAAPPTTLTSPTTTPGTPPTTSSSRSPSSPVAPPATSSATDADGTTTTGAGLVAAPASTGSSGVSPSAPAAASPVEASNPVGATSSSGALASTGVGTGDRWMAAVGATLLLLGFGALIVEDVPRRVRRLLAGVGSGWARPLSHRDTGAQRADSDHPRRPMALDLRAVQARTVSSARRLGNWVLGR